MSDGRLTRVVLRSASPMSIRDLIAFGRAAGPAGRLGPASEERAAAPCSAPAGAGAAESF